VNAAKSEVVLVHAPSGEYVFCVIAKNQQNKGTEYDNDGYVLIRDVSRMLWQHFEPDSTWQPEPDAKRWAKPDW
jgi:beta-lactamase class A